MWLVTIFFLVSDRMYRETVVWLVYGPPPASGKPLLRLAHPTGQSHVRVGSKYLITACSLWKRYGKETRSGEVNIDHCLLNVQYHDEEVPARGQNITSFHESHHRPQEVSYARLIYRTPIVDEVLRSSAVKCSEAERSRTKSLVHSDVSLHNIYILIILYIKQSEEFLLPINWT